LKGDWQEKTEFWLLEARRADFRIYVGPFISPGVRAGQPWKGSMLHFNASKRAISAAVSLRASAMAGLIAILGFASPASAELVSVTYWGTVGTAYDQTGVFGPADADLYGDSYVAHYVFDTALGNIVSSPSWNEAVGGSYYGVASPAVSASVTINGHTANIGGGNYIAEIWGSDGVQADYAWNIVDDGITYISNESWDTTGGNNIPSSIIQPFTSLLDGGAGFFMISTQDIASGQYDEFADGYVTLTGMTVGPVEAVPEPSTWAMMLLGFAGLGYAGFRRAKRNSPAFAD
jgi:hypothetical protein